MRRALPLLAVLSLAFAPAPLPRKERTTDLERLRGEWKLVSITLQGAPQRWLPDAVIIEGDRIRYLLGGRAVSEWTLSLDARSSPRRCVMRGMGVAREQEIAVGVYALHGDVLRLCYRYTIDGPPAEDFRSDGKGTWVEVLERKSR